MYEFELWNAGKVQVADVGHLLKGLSFSLERNAAETLQAKINLRSFEDYCARIGEYPRNILEPYVTDIKVKRSGEYLFGTQVTDVDGSGEADEGSISIKALGYLGLLTNALVTKTYGTEGSPGTYVETTEISRNLIATVQAAPQGNFGITMGVNQYQTGVTRLRTYVDQKVAEGIVNLTDLESGRFDFSFTHDRKFQTWQMLGDERTDVVLAYPGNVGSFSVTRAGNTIFNWVKGTGATSGSSSVALASVQEDGNSQLTYGLRQTTVSFSSVSVQSTLDENTLAYLRRHRGILEIPKLTVRGSEVDLLSVMPGNRIMVKVVGHPMYDTINGRYRIEKTTVTLDENFHEKIDLELDLI